MPSSVSFLGKKLVFRAVLGSKLSRRSRDFPCILCPQHAWSPLLSTSPTRAVHLSTIYEDGPSFKHHDHPKSVVSIRVCSWCYTFYRFGTPILVSYRVVSLGKYSLCPADSSLPHPSPQVPGNH